MKPYRTTYKESQSLKGLAKMKFDKEHKKSFAKYPEMCGRLQNLLEQGEKITPKQWKAEIQSLQSEYDSISREKSRTATELAYAEVISYKTLKGSFRKRADGITDNKVRLSGGRKKFNENAIEI